MKYESIESVLRLTVDQMLEGIQIIDKNWKYVYLNTAALRHAQREKESLIGRTMMESYPGIDQTGMFKDLMYVMERRILRRIENHFEYPDGQKLWFELFVEPHPSGILIRSVDISERKSLESQLRHSQRMDAIGQVSASIAHDFNNKLGIILAFAEMAQILFNGSNKEGEEYLIKIAEAAKQSASLTKKLMGFSRKQILDFKSVNLNELLEKSSSTLRTLLGEGILVHFDLSGSLENVYIDPHEMEQVILNLAINARDAMNETGKLTIETRNVKLDEAYAIEHPNIIPGEFVMLTITDTGSGIPKDILPSIFDPFFTTKTEGRGTGLGLSMVQGFIRQSSGDIFVYSELGIGTTFKIYIPIAGGTATLPGKPIELHANDASQANGAIQENGAIHENDATLGNHEQILLIEDDDLLRDAYASGLLNASYQVTVAKNAKEARESLHHSNDFRLVITDVILPDGLGPEILMTLSSNMPDLKVVYMSGYTEASLERHGLKGTNFVLIRKPFSMQVFLKTIYGVLNGSIVSGIY